MYSKYFLIILSLFYIVSCTGSDTMIAENHPLEGINITIDPGHGDTEAYDSFRVGPTGEREEWINLRVAKLLRKKLIRAGANVQMTRDKNRDVSLGGRAAIAKLHQSDLLVSIHHNGSENDPGIDLPLVYFFGSASMNPASVDLAQILLDKMREDMNFEQPLAGSVYSDHLIYSSGTSILRNTIDQMPGVIGEGGFFTHPKGEQRLKSKKYNELEAEVYFKASLEYFNRGIPSAKPLIPDTLDFIDLSKTIRFQLDDGFNNTSFKDSTFMILQDGEPLPVSWNPLDGVLSVQPVITEARKVSFQVFGRNSRGNAIHPHPFTFFTERGYLFFSEDKWQVAFDKAEALFNQFESKNNIPEDEMIHILAESLRLYRLSIELQIVHPKAIEAEKRILTVLKLKQDLLEEDVQEEIEIQIKRLREYYP